MNLTLLWLVIGAVLCLMELFVPTAFVEMAMGLAAFVVAVVALVIPQFSLQVLLWMAIALLFVWQAKRLLPKRPHYSLAEATEAQTITAIEPGKPGRAMFEGNSWQARTEGDYLIPANTTVLVVGRRGNTLVVVPEDFLK